MLQRYEKIVDRYKLWHPNLYEQTVECMPCGKHSILATLKDGTRLEYIDVDNTIRDVTKFFIHKENPYLDEVKWKREFGLQLRKIIAERGVTQDKLSEMTGISRQMLSRYVRGNSTPSGYTLSILSDALNCDIRDLTKFGYIDEE